MSNTTFVYNGKEIGSDIKPQVESVTFKESTTITFIGWRAFYDCINLCTIEIPSSITTIQQGAFGGCLSLERITIPSSVSSIGAEAFLGCSSLQTISIPSSITTIEGSTFEKCTRLETVTIPSSVTTIGREAFQGCTSIQIIDIPSSVKKIKEYAFRNCKNLETVSFSPSSTMIRRGAFANCSKLSEESLILISDSFTKELRVHDTFQQGPGPKLGFRGATQNGWGPEYWGITLHQMENILNHPCVTPDTTTKEMVEIAIKPATKGCGLGYALLLNSEKEPLHAEVFVSVSLHNVLNFQIKLETNSRFMLNIVLFFCRIVFIPQAFMG